MAPGTAAGHGSASPPLLRAAGHQPTVVDLPATGPDGDGATLQDHADHLRRSIEACAVPPAVVAHSYAGLVTQQALTPNGPAIEHVVLLDAWLGDDGDSMLSLAPTSVAELWRTSRLTTPTGDVIPPLAPEHVGVVRPDDVAWLGPRLTDQPWATFADPLRRPAALLPHAATAVVCDPVPRLPFERYARDRGLPVVPIGTGHDAMVTAPAELAAIIVQILAGPVEASCA